VSDVMVLGYMAKVVPNILALAADRRINNFQDCLVRVQFHVNVVILYLWHVDHQDFSLRWSRCMV